MSGDGAYSSNKIFHHRETVDALRQGGQPNPTHVQIILSDLCNENCSFCAYRLEGYISNQMFGVTDALTGVRNNNPNRMIAYGKVVEILDDCRNMGVKAIQITGGGEPTVHPQHHLIFSDVLDRGLDLALVTNGVILRPGVPETLARASWVRVSIDAGSPETYASMRSVSPNYFAKAWATVRSLADARDRVKDRRMVLGVGYVVTKENYHEVATAARLARDNGADNLRISAFFQSDDEKYYVDFFEEAADLCREAAAVSTDKFTVFNRFGDRVSDLRQRNPDYQFCGYQHVTTYIGGDLSVFRCCNLAYNERGLIGSLKDQRFSDLWFSSEKEGKFANFDARGCERCQFNGINRQILYAIDPSPLHVNFV